MEEHGNKIIDYHESIPKDEKYRMRNVAFNLHSNNHKKKSHDYLIDIDKIKNEKKYLTEDYNINKYKELTRYNFDNINNTSNRTDEFDFFEQLPVFGKNKEPSSSFTNTNNKMESSFLKRLKEREKDEDKYAKYDTHSTHQINRNANKNINERLNEMDEKIKKEKEKDLTQSNNSFLFDGKNSINILQNENNRNIENELEREKDFTEEFYKTFKELKDKENELELNNSIDINEFIQQKETEKNLYDDNDITNINEDLENTFKLAEAKSKNSRITESDYGVGDKPLTSKRAINEYFDHAYLMDNEDIFEEIKESNDTNIRKHSHYGD